MCSLPSHDRNTPRSDRMVQVTKRPERASHLPHYQTHPVFYHSIETLDKESRKGETRTNLIRKWRERTERHRQA